ncbi:MAG TPA: cupin domain-containing protein [Sulfuricurvum sp.]|nr:cupin domain-containing protein [Sulfuricurvum sp.]
MIYKRLDTIESMPQKAGKGVSMKMLLSLQEVPNFAMRCFTIEAGGHMPHHTNTVEHEQYVISGRARVTSGEKTFEAEAGDILYIPATEAHSYETIGDEPYVFLCLIPKGEDCIEIVGC